MEHKASDTPLGITATVNLSDLHLLNFEILKVAGKGVATSNTIDFIIGIATPTGRQWTTVG